jgi:hypothetical protein
LIFFDKRRVLLYLQCYVDTSPHMTLGHMTPFRVYSRASAPFFLHQSYYIRPNCIFLQHTVRTMNSDVFYKSLKGVFCRIRLLAMRLAL